MPGVEEDPDCSNSKVCDVIADHTTYLGKYTGCGNSSSDEYEEAES
jgi:hypothetical protein